MYAEKCWVAELPWADSKTIPIWFKMFTTSFSMATRNVPGVVSNIFKPIIIPGLISGMLQLIKYFSAFTFVLFSGICLLTISLPQINSFSQYRLLMLMMQIFTTLWNRSLIHYFYVSIIYKNSIFHWMSHTFQTFTWKILLWYQLFFRNNSFSFWFIQPGISSCFYFSKLFWILIQC